jgi:iron complex transport system substrate-binding protein
VRPAEARSKPKVSTFLEADVDKILALTPDLVIGFSDLQADIARKLVLAGVPVAIFNQRSVGEILQVIRVVAGLVGKPHEGQLLAAELLANLERVREAARVLPRRPRVFFEEWPDPLIAGIRWVSELIEIAGGLDVCTEKRTEKAGKGRIVDPAEIARRRPDVVIASWCGKKADRRVIASRPGWSEVPAVEGDQIYEVKSPLILQPGPAALGDGLDEIARIIGAWARGAGAERTHKGM